MTKSSAVRSLVSETRLTADDLVMPLFVVDGEGDPQPIESMPGQSRLCLRDLVVKCEQLALRGIRAVALFPCLEPSFRDETGSEALNPDTIVSMIRIRVQGNIGY